jgi:hypothetical protein
VKQTLCCMILHDSVLKYLRSVASNLAHLVTYLAMDTIKAHIESRDYAALVNFCEDLELQVNWILAFAKLFFAITYF